MNSDIVIFLCDSFYHGYHLSLNIKNIQKIYKFVYFNESSFNNLNNVFQLKFIKKTSNSAICQNNFEHFIFSSHGENKEGNFQILSKIFSKSSVLRNYFSKPLENSSNILK